VPPLSWLPEIAIPSADTNVSLSRVFCRIRSFCL